MADVLLFHAIDKLIGKLGSMVAESWNMRHDLEKLVENMSEIKAVVLDAEEQQSINNHQVQLWLEKLKDALHDADDLLGDFHTEELRRQVMTTNHKKAKKVRIFFSSSNQLLFSFKMVGKIKELGKIIEALNVGKRIFNFTNHTPEQRVFKQRETHSFVREEEVIGREEEKKQLLEWLFDTSINVKENVSVVSIIGVGGLGKTTLAQLVYNNKEVQQHFELMKWVCVSDDFDVKGIAAKIIESNTKVEMDKVQLELRKKVEGKRYLLVLDDIWNEDRDHWLQLITLLKDGAKGSKIIITARIKKVAEISGSSSIFFLKGLDEKQSWRLFSQLAFEKEKELENENLVSIGKEIVKKMLRDYLIEKQMLIRLWIAQGFVQSSDENISLEDIGEKCLMDFIHKSFFQNITKRFDGKVCFQMHDIVHDLASVISRSDYVLVNETGQHVDKHIRHVSIGFKLDCSWQVPTSLLNAYKLRTFLLPLHTVYYEFSIEVSACNAILSSFRRFRVLNLNYRESLKIPSCIGSMKHLRLRELPKDLWKLVSLRHLELYGCTALTCMPRGIGKMTNLQTLTLFVLDVTSNDSAKASELRGLNNLRGRLEIKGLECLRHCSTEAKHINLMGKPHLYRLTLNWKLNSAIFGDVNDLEKDDIILHDIVMHSKSNIKVLHICGFGGVTLSSLVNLSTNLDELRVYRCTRLKYLELTPLHVKCIWLTNLPSLEWIVNDNNNGDNSSSTFCASIT
ncbi:unnamed protein product [Trifolium pratense]|uniref:Uncharacterized protein n=1 Tax=Trifolium pratense TaxID=57577 RepID=A0ACB0KGJ3_TRIPR|nr:unnamed protein product [Trifolium pratense]